MRIAVGRSRHDTNWQTQEWTWEQLTERLSQVQRTSETAAEFAALPASRRADIKDVGGFVGGELHGGRRKRDAIGKRWLLTLDIDHAEGDFWDQLTLLHDFRCVLYSTHSHTPEHPRLRLVIELSRPTSPEEYPALGRIVASWLGIDQFDDTTYESARLMYWPSAPSDGEYVFEQQDGPALDVNAALATLADWRDVSQWPRSSRESHIEAPRGARQADPQAKPGLVGAFCRTHSVTEAMQRFLPGVYTSTDDPNRWTYSRGESSGGMVIYDGDLFGFSHHETDPAGGQLVNAFDLVRLHRFGDLDAGSKPGAPTNRLPSYEAMLDLARGDEAVKRLLDAERRAEVEDEFRPLPEGEELDGEWQGLLERDKRGRIADTLPSLVTILERDQRLQGIIWDELAGIPRIQDSALLPWTPLRDGSWSDADFDSLMVYIAKAYGIQARERTATALSNVTTQQRRHHPIREWLAGLPTWDGVERLDTLLIDHLGAEDSTYTRAATRKLVVAMIARALRPGVKFDHVVVLQGPQGIGKSVLCSRLGGPWFTDSVALPDMRDKTASEKLQGVWLCELSEMSGMRKTEVEVVKSFITRTEDHYRAAYARNVETRPRSCVFVGTTNDSDGFLRDITGNRRFWPITVTGLCPRRPWDLTDELLEQVFAEAMHRFTDGEELYLTGEAAEQAREAQRGAMESDERSGIVQAWLDVPLPLNWNSLSLMERRQWFTSRDDFGAPADVETVQRDVVSNIEIWTECFGRNASEMTRRDSYDLAALMRQLPDWENAGRRLECGPHGQQRCHERRSR